MFPEASTDVSTATAAVLARARQSRAAADAAEGDVLMQAVAWARIHEVVDPDTAATWGDSPVPIAGAGAPLVSQFCIHEFAAAVGMSPDAGRSLIAEAMELAHRLPRCWARVQAGGLVSWRARRIAASTLALSPAAASYVDVQVAPFAHQVGFAQLERLIDQAIARHDPALAAVERQRAADGRHVTINHQQVSFAGTSQVYGELDLADALDLDAAVTSVADQLKVLGSVESLEVRRARAAGELARTQLALGFEAEASCPVVEEAAQRPSRNPGSRRDVVLYVHLAEAAVRAGGVASDVATVENRGPHLVTAQTIREWLGVPGTKISVRPVIDLNLNHHADGYVVPDRIADQATLRDRTCVFPWCTRPARTADKDHIVPYGRHRTDDTGGPTQSDNIGCLCRRHHRLKTHEKRGGGWTYTQLEPGTYLWRSPLGLAFLRDPTGTTDVTGTDWNQRNRSDRPRD